MEHRIVVLALVSCLCSRKKNLPGRLGSLSVVLAGAVSGERPSQECWVLRGDAQRFLRSSASQTVPGPAMFCFCAHPRSHSQGGPSNLPSCGDSGKPAWSDMIGM